MLVKAAPRCIPKVCLSVWLLAAALSCGPADQPPRPATVSAPGQGSQQAVDVVKKWAYLFYDDADFAQGYDPLTDFAAEMAASPDLHVLVLQDTYGGPATVWSIDGGGRLIRVKDLGEVNMGGVGTVRSFAELARTNFPAQHYVVAFYDHGFGWAGACRDDTSGGDSLSMEEIRSGLSDLGHVDVVLFTAPCLMGAVESVYELRDLVDIYVGSEDTSGYMWWFGTPGWIRDTLTDDPDISTSELAEGIIQNIAASSPSNCKISPAACEDLTMSAVRPALLPKVNSAFNALIREMGGDTNGIRPVLDRAAATAQTYDGYSIDLYDLVEAIAGSSASDQIRTRSVAVQHALSRAVLAETHGPGRPGSHGLTVYFPTTSGETVPYTYRYLDFAAASLWDELLLAYETPPTGASPPSLALVPLGDGLLPPRPNSQQKGAPER
jgi:hypothetical protein